MKYISLFVVIIHLVLSQSLPAAEGAEDVEDVNSARPNIVFIFGDDWGWGDLGCHGHPYVKTPNIDRLAREGTDFHRFTVASGVCSPSRTAVMTGHFPARYNIDGHFAWVPSNAKRNMPDWLDTEATTLPRLLQSGGYATAHFGKWHLSNDMIPDSPSPAEYGYDTYGAFNCSGEQIPVHEDARRAIAFIEQCHRAGKPFFINLWVHEPHTPFHVVPKYRWQFRDSELDETDEIYAAVLSHADDRIGELLDTLDRLKLTDNTLVIFSSDNGPARSATPKELQLMYDTATGAGYGIAAAKGITAGRKGYKAALFEGGINVPFIARWPGKIAAGAVNDNLMISAVDLLPTFCETAGVSLPNEYEPDGISQLAGLLGKEISGREKPLFWKMQSRWPARSAQPFHWVSYAVMDQNWKLLASENASHVELYNIVEDPLEKQDLKESNPEQVASLLEKLSHWKSTLPAKPSEKHFSTERKSMKQPSSKSTPAKTNSVVAFADDAAFLNRHTELIVLQKGDAAVAVAPAYQGRVMTSTFDRESGPSFGWINRPVIEKGLLTEEQRKGQLEEHIYIFGGEERFWLGPEGGQFSLFFKPGTKFEFADWTTPAVIDTDAFALVEQTDESAKFNHECELVNYSGTKLKIGIERTVKILGAEDIATLIAGQRPGGIRVVGYETDNRVTNNGEHAWTPETGLISIWMLGMYNPSPKTTVVIPFKAGDPSQLGPQVNDTYFGKVPPEHLQVRDDVLFFRGDGTRRGKIGIGPQRTKGIAGSYDAAGGVLTIVTYNEQPAQNGYVNSMWELQDEPFAGDVINAYNDGSPEPGKPPLGPFYELETSSPAAALKPGETMKHVQKTWHIQGDQSALGPIVKRLLGVSLDEITSAF